MELKDENQKKRGINNQSLFFLMLCIFLSMVEKRDAVNFLLFSKNKLQVNLPVLTPVTQESNKWMDKCSYKYHRSLEFWATKGPP